MTTTIIDLDTHAVVEVCGWRLYMYDGAHTERSIPLPRTGIRILETPKDRTHTLTFRTTSHVTIIKGSNVRHLNAHLDLLEQGKQEKTRLV